MSAFAIFHLTVKDPETFGQYAAAVPPTLEPFGGSVALRGSVAAVMSGSHPHLAVGVLRFPDADSLAGWYASEAYQALIPLRDEGADVVAISYDAK